MRRLLLLEDTESLGQTLSERLTREGYAVSWAKSIGEAKNFKNEFDIAVIDLMLPDGSGFDYAKSSLSPLEIPIIFLTAMNSAENRLQGYELGAVDFIPKPFHIRELILRLERFVKKEPTIEGQKIKCGSFNLDVETMEINYPDGQSVSLQSRDFRLLEFLVSSSPKIISRDEIIKVAWKNEAAPSNRSIDNSVVRIRQLVPDGDKLIRSVRGVGYQFRR